MGKHDVGDGAVQSERYGIPVLVWCGDRLLLSHGIGRCDLDIETRLAGNAISVPNSWELLLQRYRLDKGIAEVPRELFKRLMQDPLGLQFRYQAAGNYGVLMLR